MSILLNNIFNNIIFLKNNGFKKKKFWKIILCLFVTFEICLDLNVFYLFRIKYDYGKN